MKIETEVPLIDTLLAAHRDTLGAAYLGYLNHCRRVFNFFLAFTGGQGERERIAIAAAFHDLGIWVDRTFDYLEPSRRLVRGYLAETGRSAWSDEIEAMIEQHHKITACRGAGMALVEAFRKADWVDASLGLLHWELPRSTVAAVRAALPNAGFHKTLAQLIGRRLRTHPLSPLPMMRL